MTLSNFFKKKTASLAPIVNRPCQPDVAVGIVGDVHGCLSLLKGLCDQLDTEEHIVFVGDYIDRGEDSAGVLTWLQRVQQTYPTQVTCLMGNHEAMMLDFLDNPERRGPRWLAYGGLQTLASFGVHGAREIMRSEELVATRDRLQQAMPEGMETWLRSLPTSWSSGNLWVVHAAADPAVSMSEQTDDTFLWGCETFFQAPRSDGIWIAHGHTLTETPAQRNSRISVDTGAYHTGRLTAARCRPNGEVFFAQASN